MSTVTAVATDEPAAQAPRCYCCDSPFPNDRLVRLHCHREVAVCFGCLDWLVRQRRGKRVALIRAALPRPLAVLVNGRPGRRLIRNVEQGRVR